MVVQIFKSGYTRDEYGDRCPFGRLRAGSRLSLERSSTWIRCPTFTENSPGHAEGTHLMATCAPFSIPPTIPLLRRISIWSCSDTARVFCVAATTRPKGQFDAGSAASAGSNSAGFKMISALSAASSNATPSRRTMRYGFRQVFISWMRSNRAGSAAGMACNTTSGAGGFGASGCEEHATSGIPSSTIDDTPIRNDLPITGPRLPHHRGNIIFRCPDQRDEPSNHAPAQEQVEQKDREEVPLAPGQGNDRWQKIHHEPKTEERKEKEVCENH